MIPVLAFRQRSGSGRKQYHACLLLSVGQQLRHDLKGREGGNEGESEEGRVGSECEKVLVGEVRLRPEQDGVGEKERRSLNGC